MGKEILTRYKLFGAWNDDKEEAWLGEMAQKGLHLQSLGFPGVYYFTTGEPREDVYRLDFIVNRKDYHNYLQLFQDAGWEHIGEMGGWQYFRTRKEGGRVTEIYTDNASKMQKYSRLLSILIVFLPIYVIMATRPVGDGGSISGMMLALKVFFAFIMIIYAYAILRIIRRISQLKRESKQ
jgi:hypothetical protein